MSDPRLFSRLQTQVDQVTKAVEPQQPQYGAASEWRRAAREMYSSQYVRGFLTRPPTLFEMILFSKSNVDEVRERISRGIENATGTPGFNSDEIVLSYIYEVYTKSGLGANQPTETDSVDYARWIAQTVDAVDTSASSSATASAISTIKFQQASKKQNPSDLNRPINVSVKGTATLRDAEAIRRIERGNNLETRAALDFSGFASALGGSDFSLRSK